MDVTDVEFDKFAAAVNHLKNDGTWALIAKVHAASERQHYKTHGDPKTFLPWHRKFFVEVENRLQMASKEMGNTDVEACSMTIPYWNWALDSANFATARIWQSDRLGAIDAGHDDGDLDNRMCVRDGKFGVGVAGSEFGKPGSQNPFTGGWFRPPGCTNFNGVNACAESLSALNRGQGTDCIFRKGGGLRNTVNYAQTVTALKEHEAYRGIDNYEAMALFLERQIHNDVHTAVGGNIYISPGTPGVFSGRKWGHMTSFYSPYDPTFFFHHGFMDFLWTQWQETHVTAPWRDNHHEDHFLNNLLWDGNADVFPTSDVAMAMDIKDDDPRTARVENVCVKYHERQSNHVCGDKWSEIQQCFDKLVTYEKLHTVPRIRHMTTVGDVCDPLNQLHFDNDRMWLETMVAAGMMQADKIDEVLAWERDQLEMIENTTSVLDVDVATECDKALCFSTDKMLEICNDCQSQGWSLTCHCSTSGMTTQSGSNCWESRN
jgi:hypothetical protein